MSEESRGLGTGGPDAGPRPGPELERKPGPEPGPELEREPGPEPGTQSRERHRRFLEGRVFQVRTKWPHYRRLLEDLVELAEGTERGCRIVCLERAFVFGGQSLFAALFDGHAFHAHDVRLEGLEEIRFGYQAGWLDHPDADPRPVKSAGLVTELPFEDASVDLLLVPNVVHHVRDQDGMFAEIARILRPGGRGYIFETLLRELHQAPHDFVRWTPWGFGDRLGAVGLHLTEWRPAGGPFEAIAYCWEQALQYLPEPLRSERTRWLAHEHFPQLMALEAAYPTNLVRAHTSFPIAYGVHFTRPEDSDRGSSLGGLEDRGPTPSFLA